MNRVNLVPIKEIGRVVTGKTPLTSVADNYGGDYMFVTPLELHTDFIVQESQKTLSCQGLDSIRSNSIKGFSIAVGCIGWDMGNVALIEKECATNQQINSITDIKPGYNPYYLYYWLLTKKEYLFQIATVTRTPILNKTTFEDILVPMPSKEVQDSIVELLLPISQKIALNNSINAELEKVAKTLYDYWFVQFDFPNASGRPYRASGGAMKYSEQMKREIPKGWRVQKLNKTSLCTIMSSGIDKFDGEKIYLSTSEVDGTEIVNHSVITDYANRLQRANMQPRLNSVWFAKMKDTMKNILVNEGVRVLESDYIFSTGFAGLQCVPTSLYYIWNYLRGGYFENKKNHVATGATQQAINDDDLKGFDILVPPESLLDRFQKTVSPYYHMISNVKIGNKELSELRDFLLPLLMNGQVTISTTEVSADV
jgi:type I restriction enzyme S subunit